MPNYVRNKLFVIGGLDAEIDELLDSMKGENGDFDFNSFVPEPEGFDYEEKGVMPAWWEWREKNWGTKWNAMKVKVTGSTIEFETAWTGAHKIVLEIAKRFPMIMFEYICSSEDGSAECYKYEYYGGKLQMKTIYPGGSGRAKMMHCALWPEFISKME